MEIIGKVRYTNQPGDTELGNYVIPGQIYDVTDDSSDGLLIINLNVNPPTFFAASPEYFEIIEDPDGKLERLFS